MAEKYVVVLEIIERSEWGEVQDGAFSRPWEFLIPAGAMVWEVDEREVTVSNDGVRLDFKITDRFEEAAYDDGDWYHRTYDKDDERISDPEDIFSKNDVVFSLQLVMNPADIRNDANSDLFDDYYDVEAERWRADAGRTYEVIKGMEFSFGRKT